MIYLIYIIYDIYNIYNIFNNEVRWLDTHERKNNGKDQREIKLTSNDEWKW